MERKGWIEVVVGPMFCGKSEDAIRRASQARFAGLGVQAFKHNLDQRYEEKDLASHSGARFPALAVPSSQAILENLRPDTQVVVIDEAQFFDLGLPGVCVELANRGLRVIVSGLDQDFRGEPFDPVPALMAQAEEATKLWAICYKCGQRATMSQRLIDGEPAACDDPVIIVGTEEYHSCCRTCHKVGPPRQK